MKKKYLIILIVLIIFVLLSILLGKYIFTCMDYAPMITEIEDSNIDMGNVIHLNMESL